MYKQTEKSPIGLREGTVEEIAKTYVTLKNSDNLYRRFKYDRMITPEILIIE